MNVEQIFKKPLTRNINGVVKAEQRDEESKFVELDEYVITNELNTHLTTFFDAYTPEIDGSPNDGARNGKVAVWLSGFFGSGKSHLLKILGYLLENKEAAKDSTHRKAIDFFREKVEDGMLLGNMQRAVEQPTDVILFNIDSRANTEDREDAILKVFLRVFNERVGYCGEYPFIAHLERQLDQRGQYQTFKSKFEELAGSAWEDERDAFDFFRDDMAEALAHATEQSLDATNKWVDQLEANFPLDIQNFCKWVNEHIESTGRNVVFMVDEVGQFIGRNSAMMLKLQTIAEDLGTFCGGRAWLVVTAQADIDKALGHLDQTQGLDFSKIQGRFATRMQLSSSNTSEVIQKRLLSKTDEAKTQLDAIFAEKGDILRNQLTFDQTTTASLKRYEDSDSFVANYPFVPYHYELVQKVFETIRTKGATGKHLAMGERSLLDAFQHAAKQVKDKSLDVLIPFYSFYAPIESFLEPAVKRTIEQASDNTGLKEYDSNILKTLFLIRYVDLIKSTLDNLVTLSITQIDDDKIALRNKIEESLNRLEKQMLIARNGDEYVFLTNEEKEIENEIRHTDVEGSEVTNKLSEIIFDEILRRQSKYRYPENKQDFPIARYCNGHPKDGSLEADLIIKVVSPLDIQYDSLSSDQACRSLTSNEASILVKMPNHDRIYDELTTYMQTARFISLNGGQRPEQEHLIRDKQLENSQRGKRLSSELEELFKDSDVFAIGEKLQIKSNSATAIAEEAYKYVIENSFSKLRLLKPTPGDVLRELRSVLEADDMAQLGLDLDDPAVNPDAIKDMEQFLTLKSERNERVYLADIERRYTRRPYGWPINEIMLIVARLGLAGRLSLVRGNEPLPLSRAYDAMQSVRQRNDVLVRKVRQHNEGQIRKAAHLAKDIFQRTPPMQQEKELESFIREGLKRYQHELESFKAKAAAGHFPGKETIDDALMLVNELLGKENSYTLIDAFVDDEERLLDLLDDFEDLDDFYNAQFNTWLSLQHALEREFKDNETYLRRNEEAAQALNQLEDIYAMPAPYAHVNKVKPLIETVKEVSRTLVDEQRTKVMESLEASIERVLAVLDNAAASPDQKNAIMRPLQKTKMRAESSNSIPEIISLTSEQGNEEEEAYERVNDLIKSRAAEKAKQAQQKPQSSPSSESETTKTPSNAEPKAETEVQEPVPQLKQIISVQPGQVVPTAQFLESEQDVEDYLNQLREKLMQQVNAGFRIRLK